MANIYGFDSYGTDLYTRSQGGIWLNKRTSTTRPREIINFTELESQNQMLKQYIKLNGDGLYEVKIPGKPTTVFYNEADAINNCRYQLTNTSVTSLGGNATGAPRTTTRVPNSAVYPNANGAAYARMLEQNPLPPQNVDVVGNTPAGNTSKTSTPAQNAGTTPVSAQQANTPAENTPANTKRSRAEKLKEIRSNPEARARYNRLKLRNNPELKARYDRMANFKKMKGLKKAGKWGAIAALAIGAGALLLNKCSDDKKAAAPVEPTKPAEPEKPTTPTEPETPVTPAPAQETENSAINAVKGDDYWKYAKMELIAEHQGDVNYKPTDAEIYTRMKEIMARTNIGMADDNVHSDPLLMVNDEVQLNEQAAKLRNEAIKQLKEEHKNQDNYEPTYSEVNKKFKELVAKAQAEAAEKAEA